MNLVKTLARVAMGVMVARGVGKMLGGGSGRTSPQQSGSGGGLGGLLGGGMRRPSSSGSPDIGSGIGGSDGVGGLSRGNSPSSGSASSGGLGGLGGLLGGMTGGGSSPSAGSGGSSSGGGLADILGSVLGGGSSSAGGAQRGGGLGDLLESLGGDRNTAGSTPSAGSAGSGSLGDLLNQAFGGQTAQPQPEQNAHAEILLRGMLNAAKSDGKFDSAEQQKVMDHLGDASDEELSFVRAEMSTPLDVDVYVHSVPRGLEQQVYVMSVLGIELDSQAEAQYLDKLARGLGINADQVNAIHQQLGVPKLYG